MDGRGDGSPRRFRLLFVCTGNICRSPFARFHTRALLEMRLGPRWASWFEVASGGTGAVVGSEMHPLSRAQLGPLATHPDVAAFRARQLPARDVELADLVLTVSRSHRSAVLELEPRALRSTFTVREFARLLGSIDPADHAARPVDPRERAHALVGAALAERGQGAPVDSEDDAIPDPIRGGVEDHAESARLLHEAVRPLVDAIGAGVPWPVRRRPGPPPGPPPGMPPRRPGPPPQQGPPQGPPPGAPFGPPPGMPVGPVPAGHVPAGHAPEGPPSNGHGPPGALPPGPVPPGTIPPGTIPPGARPPARMPGPPSVLPPGAQVPRPPGPIDALSPGWSPPDGAGGSDGSHPADGQHRNGRPSEGRPLGGPPVEDEVRPASEGRRRRHGWADDDEEDDLGEVHGADDRDAPASAHSSTRAGG